MARAIWAPRLAWGAIGVAVGDLLGRFLHCSLSWVPSRVCIPGSSPIPVRPVHCVVPLRFLRDFCPSLALDDGCEACWGLKLPSPSHTWFPGGKKKERDTYLCFRVLCLRLPLLLCREKTEEVLSHLACGVGEGLLSLLLISSNILPNNLLKGAYRTSLPLSLNSLRKTWPTLTLTSLVLRMCINSNN